MPNLDKNKVVSATKWSTTTEVVAKLITPVTSMILARLLTPEAYGVVATLNMIIVFADIFTDAGFQKYIIQHEFKDVIEQDESINVAFWSNLIMSLVIWMFIIIFSTPLMNLVGSPGYETALIIACAAIPIAAFSSIQTAIYRREFNFKTLFKVRIAGICVPLAVTIPCAIYFKNYWALIIGTLTTQSLNAFMLTYLSPWKPRFFYSWNRFKDMFSFTIWSMMESISVWLVNYFDVFIVGTMMSQYYLGVYKTSTALVGQILSLITASLTPVVFASLSRLQDDDKEFEKVYLKFQKFISMLVLPLGFGIYVYKQIFTDIVLGDKWVEAAGVIGLWGLVSCIMIVLNHFCGTLYRAKGKPKLSTLSEWFHIIFLIPVVYWVAHYGFETLYIVRALSRLQHVFIDMIIMTFVIHLPWYLLIKNILPSLISASIMGICSYFMLKLSGSVVWTIISIFLSSLIYFLILSTFKDERKLVMDVIINKFLKRK